MSICWRDEQLRLEDGTEIGCRFGEQSGGEAKPTLVLLHEALGCIAMWKQFPQRLAERTGCNIFIYERRGYGGSSPISLPRPDDYLVAEGRDWLPQILTAAGLRRAVLIGHSDGGSVALVGAAQQLPSVVGLITMAAHIYVDELCIAGIVETGARYRDSDLPQRLARYHGERTELLFRAWHETWLRDSFQQSLDLRPWLSRVRCPALILQGGDDQYGLPKQVDDICSGIGANASGLFLPGCGHIPHLEAEAATLDAIDSFLGRQNLLG